MGNESVLITGGAGFIGRALVERCLQLGNEVTVVDNLCTGRLTNLDPYLGDTSFHQSDVLDQESVRTIMAQSRPDIVFHLAAHHFIPFCNQFPNETLRVNVEGTHVVLNEAARFGVRVAVVASTGALYPNLDYPLSEDVQPEPSDIYGLSKQFAEQCAQFIASTNELNCVVTRLFNTYGPYETNPHLIPHIIESLRTGPSVELGNIYTKRDYIFVEDVAELLYSCGTGARENFTTVNVGTGCEHSAEQIIQAIGTIMGIKVTIQVDPTRLRTVDKLHQRADTRRLEKLTGSRARHSLMDGLRKLLAHEGIAGA